MSENSNFHSWILSLAPVCEKSLKIAVSFLYIFMTPVCEKVNSSKVTIETFTTFHEPRCVKKLKKKQL